MRDNFVAFSILLALAFSTLRFDFPYFHARHMRATGTSVLISTLLACVAFFFDRKDSSSTAAEPFGVFKRNISWKQFTFLAAGELAAGVLLYALFTFMPFALQVLFVMGCWVVLTIEWGNFPKNKSYGSLLTALTGLTGLACLVAWRITHQEVWSRVMTVIACLMAGLIFFDRRQEWFDLE